MRLRGYDLRYLLTSLILDAGSSSTTRELRRRLDTLGVELGSDPRRRLFGALRSEVRKGRLRALGSGHYAIDRLPRSTRSHIRRRVAVVLAAIEDGRPYPPPQHRYAPRPSIPPLDEWPLVRSFDDLRLPPDGQPLRDAPSSSPAPAPPQSRSPLDHRPHTRTLDDPR